MASVPACAGFVNTTNTFRCLRSASSSSLLTALSTIGSGFQPVIDGAGGIIPDRPSQLVPKTRIPTLTGTNLDEATLFAPQNIDSVETILGFLTGFAPSLLTPLAQNATLERILQLYPDIPALGSPFNTGNNTFGLNSEYKRYNAICKEHRYRGFILEITIFPGGDALIQAPRRSFAQKATSDVKLFVYHFTDPDALPIPGIPIAGDAPGSLGGELGYLRKAKFFA